MHSFLKISEAFQNLFLNSFFEGSLFGLFTLFFFFTAEANKVSAPSLPDVHFYFIHIFVFVLFFLWILFQLVLQLTLVSFFDNAFLCFFSFGFLLYTKSSNPSSSILFSKSDFIEVSSEEVKVNCNTNNVGYRWCCVTCQENNLIKVYEG